jgi:hypothetical protein
LLPETWVEEDEGTDEQQREYRRLYRKLADLAAQTKALREKKAQFQRIDRTLKPLKDPTTNIQPNIVTRDGELAKELDRMRVLMARVNPKMAALKKTAPKRDETELAEDSNAKLEKVLQT